VIAVAMLFPVPAHAWELQVTPYAWLAGVDGDIGAVPGLSGDDISLSFGDVWDSLDYAGMLFASARNGSWVVFADATATKQSVEENLGGVPGGLTVQTESQTIALAAGRTISQSNDHRIHAYFGARGWWVSNDFEVEGQVDASSDANWFDPIVGIAARRDLTDRWALIGMADIGGFGVGADFEASLLGGVTYAFSDRFGVSVAWRYLSVDYSRDDFVYNVDQSGPVVGATFRF
jgi:hypothetical protein